MLEVMISIQVIEVVAYTITVFFFEKERTDLMVKILASTEVLNVLFAIIGLSVFSDTVRYFFIFKMVLSLVNVALLLHLTYFPKYFWEAPDTTNW